MKSIEDSFKDDKRYELFTGHKSNRNLNLYKKIGNKEFKRIPIYEKYKIKISLINKSN